MTSTVREDAGPFVHVENKLPETRQRVRTISKTYDDARRLSTTSARNEIPSCVFKNDSDIVISPEDIPDEYEHNENQSGLFVLFNHETFDEYTEYGQRAGTLKDEGDLIDCLSRLRYEVKRELLFKDYTKQQIEDELLKISLMDHSKRNSLIVVFLTHGDSEGKLIAQDGSFIRCEEVWNYFSAAKCPTLKGKPKIFIFQACKGKQRSKVDGIEEDSARRSDIAKKSYTLPSEADILVSYSTLEGNVSYRDKITGSWFIQELCKNFTAYGRRDDIVTILTRISKCVAYHYQHEAYKQMPCFISTLTRKFYLCKSKERGYLLELHKQNKALSEQIEKMSLKLNEVHKNTEETKNNSAKNAANKLKKTTKLTERPRWKS